MASLAPPERTALPPAARLASAASEAALELDALRQLIAALASTDVGRRAALEIAPCVVEAELQERRSMQQEVALLLPEGTLVPAIEGELEALLCRLGRNLPCTGRDLLLVAELLGAISALRRRLQAPDAAPFPRLTAALAEVADLHFLAERIRRTLDSRGEVRDDASPELIQLGGRIRSQRDDLYRELSGLVGRYRDDLSEETLPLRGGRLMLVLRSGARGRVPGLTHGRSSTGRSFYFEPLEAVEGNNRLQQACEDEEAERQRLLAELVDAIVVARHEVAAHGELLGRIDVCQAAARYAERCQGVLPEIAPPGELRLVAARHPLLDPNLAELRAAALGNAGHRGAMVALDLELGPAARILVVTGPNAGGKTVVLKTVGLAVLAAQSGLPVPAGPGTCLPFLEALVATVGDEQDLLHERSTFSGRLLRLDEAWRQAGSNALVLLDELGSGTDPEEGAALATALLEGFEESGALGLITTHLSPVAARAMELPGAACAAMTFNPEDGRPLFRLEPGPPGGSEALALARRLGLDPGLIARAERLLGGEARDLRRQLAEVVHLRRQLSDERDELARLRHEAERQARQAGEELVEAKRERREVAQRLERELRDFERTVRRRLLEEVEQVREEARQGRRRKALEAAAERLLGDAPRLAPTEEQVKTVVLGDRVRHRGLGWEGIVERLERGRAVVRVGDKRLSCDLGELSSPRGEASQKARGTVRSPDRGDAVARQLKLIGLRVEDALEALDRYLDDALLAGESELRIVHGHGTGRLRQAVRRHLQGHPAVGTQRPGGDGEGGDGATVIRLRE